MLKTLDVPTAAALTQLCLPPHQVESAGLQFPTMEDCLKYTCNNRQMLCFHELKQPKVSCLEIALSACLPACLPQISIHLEVHLCLRQLLLVRAEEQLQSAC